tara:strand:- start:3954 stop:5234 length:1281 start_codon:yes stop_codon:yes gene_type:complete
MEVRKSRPFVLILLFSIFQFQVFGQVYLDKKSRHRFAQLSLGLDYELGLGANTQISNSAISNPNTSRVSLNASHTPRILIGGTHFWGHADFYIAIPLFQTQSTIEANTIRYQRGVETAFKYYPWRIKKNAVRPFVGVSLTSYQWQQNTGIDAENAVITYHGLPLLGGLSYQSGNYLWDLGASWNSSSPQDYYLKPDEIIQIENHQLYFTASFRILLETTLSAEKDWESGRTQKVTEVLAEQGKLDGFYIGAGFSSAFWLNQSKSTAFSEGYGNYANSVMPEFSAGYYFHKPDLSIELAYRSYKQNNGAFGWNREAGRRSLALEGTRTLFDYHGFVPFIGPFVSWERLSLESTNKGQIIDDVLQDQVGYGLCFGWDIRPNRLQGFLLRTNLRYTPNLNLALSNNRNEIFNSLEFNFIQLIIFPERMF